MLCLSYFATQCVVWLSSQTCLMEVWMKGFAFISFAFQRASKSIFMSDPFTQVFGFNANDKLTTWGKSKLFVDIQHHASHNHKWGFVPFGHVISKWTLEFPFPFCLPLKTTLCSSYSGQCTRQPCCPCMNRTLPRLAGGLPEVTAATGIGWPTLLSTCSAG